MMNKKDIIWLAGFFDGEGCINITKFRQYICPRIMVSNTNKKVLEFIQENYGGDIRENSTNKKNHPNWKSGYTYRLQHTKAVKFIKDIFPYLKVKKEQAKLLLQFYNKSYLVTIKQPTLNAKYRTIRKLTQKALDRRSLIKRHIMILNKRGI